MRLEQLLAGAPGPRGLETAAANALTTAPTPAAASPACSPRCAPARPRPACAPPSSPPRPAGSEAAPRPRRHGRRRRSPSPGRPRRPRATPTADPDAITRARASEPARARDRPGPPATSARTPARSRASRPAAAPAGIDHHQRVHPERGRLERDEHRRRQRRQQEGANFAPRTYRSQRPNAPTDTFSPRSSPPACCSARPAGERQHVHDLVLRGGSDRGAAPGCGDSTPWMHATDCCDRGEGMLVWADIANGPRLPAGSCARWQAEPARSADDPARRAD